MIWFLSTLIKTVYIYFCFFPNSFLLSRFAIVTATFNIEWEVLSVLTQSASSVISYLVTTPRCAANLKF
jgi:hypothetical protein